MNCPSCGTPQPDPPPRFCDACGLVVNRQVGTRRAAEEPTVRCGECGLPCTTRTCRNCGTRVRWPDDLKPPGEGEDFGAPPAPALELPDGEDVPLDEDGH